MREIKFRVWDSTPGYELMTATVSLADIEKGFNISGKNRTAMQYTGLKGENDVEIYEGDIYITNGDEDDCYQVMFVAGAFVGGKSSTSCMPLGWNGEEEGWPWERATIEVIGNIYENPELLEKIS